MARSHVKPTLTQKPVVQFNAEQRARFLELYAQNGRLCQSAIAIHQHPNTIALTRKRDPEFDAAVKEAKERFVESLEEEAHRRATKGTKKPVFYKGEECGAISEYSDTLLLAMLKKHDPGYRDKAQVDVNHTGGVLVVPGVAKDSDEWERQFGQDKSDAT